MTETDEDDEPLFRIRYANDEATENKSGYWEQYNASKKSWFRLCDKCLEKVRKPSEPLCVFHFKKQKKSKRKTIPKIRNPKKKLKRLDTKTETKTKTKRRKLPLGTIPEHKVEQMVNVQNAESLRIVISVSSSLNKYQIADVKEFVTKFHNESQSIEFTCQSQLDYMDDTTTHIITTDSGSFTTLLTKEIIQACVRHIFVSSINWIKASLEQLSIADYFPYEILRDKNALKNSRGIKQCRFDQLPVFPSSYIISVECQKGVKQMKMNREEVIELVELSGATLLRDYIQYKTLIILCNSKAEVASRKKQNDDNLCMINEKTIYYCKPEFLFDSIVRHEVQSKEMYSW